jgi:hypothetical protein
VQVINPTFKHIAWYGVEIVGACRNIVVHDISGHDCRHTVSYNWISGYGKPINCHIIGGTADYNTKSGIDAHPNSAKNCTINNVISQGSRGDSGYLVRTSGLILDNCQGNKNFFDGLTVRFTDKQVIANNFIAKLNNRDGIRATEYGVKLLNPITEDNVGVGVHASSAFISGGSSERNAYAYRIAYNASDLNRFIINDTYAPFSTGRQTVGVFISNGYDAQKLIVNSNDFTGYGDFVFSVPTGMGTSYVCQTDGNNKIHNSVTGGLLYGTVVFASAGSATVDTTSFRNLIAPTTTRGVLISNVDLKILSSASGVTASYRPITDKVSFEITATGACTVQWRILGI